MSKKRTPDEISQEALLNRTPENWEPPTEPPFTRIFNPIVISSGIVLGIGRKDSVTLVRHRKAVIWVHWHGAQLPPGIKIGARAVYIGKLRTFNLGHHLQVVDAMLLKSSPRALLMALVTTLPGLIVDPKTYLKDPENVDLA